MVGDFLFAGKSQKSLSYMVLGLEEGRWLGGKQTS